MKDEQMNELDRASVFAALQLNLSIHRNNKRINPKSGMLNVANSCIHGNRDEHSCKQTYSYHKGRKKTFY